jgi:hypothetical protein
MENRNYRDNDTYKDKTIQCCDCGKDFVFTAGERAFFASKRPPLSEPRRCKPCRDFRRRTINPGMGLGDAVTRCQTSYDTADTTHQGVRE